MTPNSLARDVTALSQALNNTDAAFGALAARMGTVHWRRRSPDSPWSAGQTLTHLVLIHEFVPELVAKARRGQGAFNYWPWLVDQVNVMAARWAALRMNAALMAERHCRATAATVALAEGLTVEAWQREGRFFSRGAYSVERLLWLPASHFAEHAPVIERLLPGG